MAEFGWEGRDAAWDAAGGCGGRCGGCDMELILHAGQVGCWWILLAVMRVRLGAFKDDHATAVGQVIGR